MDGLASRSAKECIMCPQMHHICHLRKCSWKTSDIRIFVYPDNKVAESKSSWDRVAESRVAESMACIAKTTHLKRRESDRISITVLESPCILGAGARKGTPDRYWGRLPRCKAAAVFFHIQKQDQKWHNVSPIPLHFPKMLEYVGVQ